jgi:hypothetical protein
MKLLWLTTFRRKMTFSDEVVGSFDARLSMLN